MPLFSYQCPDCRDATTAFRAVASRNVGPLCCGGMMHRIFEPPEIQAQILGGGETPGYHCVVTGEYVTSRTRRREIMKEHDLIEAPKSESEGYRKRRMDEAARVSG